MDVIFEVSCSKGKRCFTIEVGFFDTVVEIKQKIHKYEGIPVSRQTLIFNGQIMIDERDTEFYEVLNWSHIQLQIEPPPTSTPTPVQEQQQQQQQPQPSGGGGGGGAGGAGAGGGGGGGKAGGLLKINEETSSSSSTCSKTKIQLLIKIPASKRQFSLGGIDLNHDTVLRLKEKIHEGEGIPINRFALFFSGNELMENRTLLDYGIGDLSEINVVIKTFPSSTTSSGGGGPMTPPSSVGVGVGGGGSNKRLKLMVLPAKSGAQKIQVEMNSMDNVGELRKELQRLQQQQPALAVHLPAEGYFFIYKQTVMEEDRSFRWHDIRQGDTIEIFNGSVTGGS